MEKKKILILSPNKNISGGVRNYIEVLSNEIGERYELQYFYIGKSDKKLLNLFYPLIVLSQNSKLKKVLSREKPDVVHLNPSLHYTAIFRDFLFLRSIKKRNIKNLFFIHGWQDGLIRKLDRTVSKGYFVRNLNRADRIIVLASQFKDRLVDMGIKKDKVSIETTMVNFSKFHPGSKTYEAPFKVLFCANMAREKGPFEVVESIPIILKRYPETEFIFVGNGKDIGDLKAVVKNLGIQKNVNITGFISNEEKIEKFQESHIFAFPTLHGEGFPTVILEAMAAGLPVITTPNAGLKDAISDGKQGFLLKTDPPEGNEIGKYIIELIEDPGKLEEIGRHNMSEAREKYDVGIVAGRIANMYDELAK